jgi:hypothetical protein
MRLQDVRIGHTYRVDGASSCNGVQGRALRVCAGDDNVLIEHPPSGGLWLWVACLRYVGAPPGVICGLRVRRRGLGLRGGWRSRVPRRKPR